MQTINNAVIFFEQKGYMVTSQEADGFIGNFPVRVVFPKNQIQVIFSIAAEDLKRVNKPLRQALKYAQFAAPIALGDVYYGIIVSLKNTDIAERYATLERTLLGIFQENHVYPLDRCPICSKSGCNSATCHGAGYRLAHRECLVNAHQGALIKAEDNQLSGNYALGLFGGLLGGIVGCIPNILTIWFAERVFALLYALIPLGIYYGYKLFKGRLNRVAIVFTILLSILFSVAIDLAVVGIGLVTEGYEFALLWELVLFPEFWSSMAPDFALSLLFIALGIAFSWSRITRTAHSDVRDMTAALDMTHPIPSLAGNPADLPAEQATSVPLQEGRFGPNT